jgi:hypothetical protein
MKPAASAGTGLGAAALKTVFVWLPVLLTFWYVNTFCVDLPYMDDWEFVPQVVNLFSGTLSWQDINAQHNDSKILVLQFVRLTLAKLTRYDVRAEMFASYACLVGCLLVLYALFGQLRRARGFGALCFLPVAWLFLGWRQFEGLLWGVHLMNTLALFFILLSFLFCLRSERRAGYFSPAIAAAVLASFTAATGLLAWPLGLLLLLVLRSGVRRLLPWMTATGLTAIAFFSGYRPMEVPWSTGFGFVLENPGSAVRYSLIYLGSGLAGTERAAMWMGTFLVVFGLAAAWFAWRKVAERPMLAFMALVALVLMSLVLLLRSRLGLGVPQAFLASRYVTLSSLAAIGIYGALLAVKDISTVSRRVFQAFVVFLIAGIWMSYSSGLVAGRLHLSELSECSEFVRCYRTSEEGKLACAFIAPPIVRQRAAMLENLHLSVFRDGRLPCVARPAEPPITWRQQ